MICDSSVLTAAAPHVFTPGKASFQSSVYHPRWQAIIITLYSVLFCPAVSPCACICSWKTWDKIQIIHGGTAASFFRRDQELGVFLFVWPTNTAALLKPSSLKQKIKQFQWCCKVTNLHVTACKAVCHPARPWGTENSKEAWFVPSFLNTKNKYQWGDKCKRRESSSTCKALAQQYRQLDRYKHKAE